MSSSSLTCHLGCSLFVIFAKTLLKLRQSLHMRSLWTRLRELNQPWCSRWLCGKMNPVIKQTPARWPRVQFRWCVVLFRDVSHLTTWKYPLQLFALQNRLRQHTDAFAFTRSGKNDDNVKRDTFKTGRSHVEASLPYRSVDMAIYSELSPDEASTSAGDISVPQLPGVPAVGLRYTWYEFFSHS